MVAIPSLTHHFSLNGEKKRERRKIMRDRENMRERVSERDREKRGI